jgi:alpha-D-ribose 1-methylphosphonate 5-triphosphate synthase subunit PhnG
LREKCAALEDALLKQEDERELVEAECNNLELEKEQMQQKINELNAELLDFADKFEASLFTLVISF